MEGHDAVSKRLAESAYNSPYSHEGAPKPHPNTDPYALLRTKALSTLEAMGYDPQTMVERGVVWAEDQDPFGHVMHSQYMHFLGICFHRVMESYDEYLSQEEYNDMVLAKRVSPVIHKYELSIKRQVKYPDSVSANELSTRSERWGMDRKGPQRSLLTKSSLLQRTDRIA